MVFKCANHWCPTLRQQYEGKLFRLDLDIGSYSGGDVQKTEYIWLCPRCSELMQPQVEVKGNKVILRLTKIDLADTNVLYQRAN